MICQNGSEAFSVSKIYFRDYFVEKQQPDSSPPPPKPNNNDVAFRLQLALMISKLQNVTAWCEVIPRELTMDEKSSIISGAQAILAAVEENQAKYRK